MPSYKILIEVPEGTEITSASAIFHSIAENGEDWILSRSDEPHTIFQSAVKSNGKWVDAMWSIEKTAP